MWQRLRSGLARAGAAAGRRAPFRAVQADTWTMSAVLGLAVGGALLLGLRTGATDPAGRFVLAMILVALPSIPTAPSAAARTLLTRTGAVVAASLLASATGGDERAVALGIVAAAAVGFTVPLIGSTAALALLMLGLRVATVPGSTPVPGLWELAGAGVVAVATVLTRLGRPGPIVPVLPPSPDAERAWTLRRVVAVALAVLLAAASPLGVYGGHWLITAVLLSVRPTPAATRLRLAQRLLGNTVAAVLVAVLMGVGAGAVTLAGVVAVLTVLAFALRPVSYLWWAVTAPPVLLIVGDFPATHNWYEGMVRVALNVVGAVIVLLVCHPPPARPRRGL
ncbi:FUSC family protein [Georgenia sp. MJ173]|uniref:FUSC family protein n=1 Tax=Georgenia sunbinii TaxID=3117728 RepID=UPI002F26818A